MSIYTYLFFVCNRLPLSKICLCCFIDMHLYSNSLSIIAVTSSVTMSKLFAACFSCSNNKHESINSLILVASWLDTL